MKKGDRVQLLREEQVFAVIVDDGQRAWPPVGAWMTIEFIESESYPDEDKGVLVRFLPPWMAAKHPQMVLMKSLLPDLDDPAALSDWLDS